MGTGAGDDETVAVYLDVTVKKEREELLHALVILIAEASHVNKGWQLDVTVPFSVTFKLLVGRAPSLHTTLAVPAHKFPNVLLLRTTQVTLPAHNCPTVLPLRTTQVTLPAHNCPTVVPLRTKQVNLPALNCPTVYVPRKLIYLHTTALLLYLYVSRRLIYLHTTALRLRTP